MTTLPGNLWNRRFLLAFALAVVLAATPNSKGATVTLTAADTLNQSSFASGLHWSDGLAPSAGNDYVVSIPQLRTPPDGNSYMFGGDSLTINSGGRFFYKGTGNAATITIGNLTLNGGSMEHQNGVGDLFLLAGNLNLAADSQIWAKQGVINISSVISGSGRITNPGSDGSGRTLVISSAANTYTGSIVNNGRFQLADNGLLNFVIGASGLNNSISGSGPENLFDGDFNFDLTGASTTVGDSWLIVSAANRSFGATFSVIGFTDLGGGWWSKPTGVGTDLYVFQQTTGLLSVEVVPEPSTAALFLAGVGLFLGRRGFRRG